MYNSKSVLPNFWLSFQSMKSLHPSICRREVGSAMAEWSHSTNEVSLCCVHWVEEPLRRLVYGTWLGCGHDTTCSGQLQVQISRDVSPWVRNDRFYRQSWVSSINSRTHTKMPWCIRSPSQNFCVQPQTINVCTLRKTIVPFQRSNRVLLKPTRSWNPSACY